MKKRTTVAVTCIKSGTTFPLSSDYPVSVSLNRFFTFMLQIAPPIRIMIAQSIMILKRRIRNG
jgi:hypothetical protein